MTWKGYMTAEQQDTDSERSVVEVARWCKPNYKNLQGFSSPNFISVVHSCLIIMIICMCFNVKFPLC